MIDKIFDRLTSISNEDINKVMVAFVNLTEDDLQEVVNLYGEPAAFAIRIIKDCTCEISGTYYISINKLIMLALEILVQSEDEVKQVLSAMSLGDINNLVKGLNIE